MPTHAVTVECPVPSSFAVDQVRGMFDLPAAATLRETFNVELPADNDDWKIGVIVGPSGSGKTTVARSAYGDRFVEGGFRWEKNKAVVDHFGKLSIKHVTQTLTSVGFSSPPAWLKPHHVLSGGERFRCDLARALLRPGDLVAFDEFTSVVDRTVARIGSAAVAKSIRQGRIGKKFVAVTCHYDVLDWLEPDWVLDMATQQLARGCLYCRPTIELKIARVHRTAWRLFRRHHYLNHDLAVGAKCFVAFWNGEPVAFSSWIHRMTRTCRRHDMREHRTVVLPDFQGIGIGNRLSSFCASIFASAGGRAFSTTSHPGMIHYRHHSPDWRTRRFGMAAPTGRSGIMSRGKRRSPAIDSCGRVTGGFEYVGPKIDQEMAEKFLADSPDVFVPDRAERAVLIAILKSPGLTSIARLARLAHYSTTRVARVLDQYQALGHTYRQALGTTRVGWGLTLSGRERFAGLERITDCAHLA
jgi:ABC-type Mn2+/Zn2+ transport system ATPase subunit/GNAT superfamily N-acetyltransferase